jgi:signal transduction histidine kinase
VLAKVHFFLSERSPSSNQKRLAGAIAAAVAIAFIALIPFRDRQWLNVNEFIPIADSILFFTDLITAAILYFQFSALRTRAMLVLATGYLFTALTIVAHLLTFPGALSPTGLFGANRQSTVWLYIFWHFGLPLAIIAYVFSKSQADTAANTRREILISVVAVVALVSGLTWLVTAQAQLLPAIMLDFKRANSLWEHVAGPTLPLISLIAIALLWRNRTSLLDTCLLVAAWAWFIEALLLSMTSSRFSLFWYAGRAAGLLSSCTVLLALLYESTMAYAALAASIDAYEREREYKRLSLEVTVGSIAHELHQPLTAIVANCDAGIQLLSQLPPDLEETKTALMEIQADGFRASDIIKSIQATLADAARQVALVDMSQAIRETLTLLRSKLQFHEITVLFETAEQLPFIRGNKGQLLQVLLKLIMNAADSMTDVTTRPRALRIRAEVRNPAYVSIYVEDSGIGIEPELMARIFDPLFTTKAGGTGLGLAICRSIIAAHDGRIAVSRGREHGLIFEILLPVHRSGG